MRASCWKARASWRPWEGGNSKSHSLRPRARAALGPLAFETRKGALVLARAGCTEHYRLNFEPVGPGPRASVAIAGAGGGAFEARWREPAHQGSGKFSGPSERRHTRPSRQGRRLRQRQDLRAGQHDGGANGHEIACAFASSSSIFSSARNVAELKWRGDGAELERRNSLTARPVFFSRVQLRKTDLAGKPARHRAARRPIPANPHPLRRYTAQFA
jgi:hypothetical protein